MRRAALPFAVGLAYCGVAWLTILLTQSRHAIPPIWPANALLLAILLVRPRREACALLGISMALSGLAVFLSCGSFLEPLFYIAANATQVLIAFRGLRSRGTERGLLSEPDSVGRMLVWAGVLAPGVSAILGGFTAWSLFGQPFLHSVGLLYLAEALGLLIFTPCLLALLGGDAWRGAAEMSGRERIEFVALLGLTALVTTHVFFWAHFPLLFVVFMPMMLVTFRTGWLGSQVALVMMALIGGGATLFGHGPIASATADPAMRVYGIQAYVAVMLLVQMPIAGALAAHKALVRRLSDSEQSLRLLASRSPILLLAFDLRGRCERVIGLSDALLDRDAGDLIGATFADVSEEGQYVLGRAHDAALEDVDQSHGAEFRAVKINDAWLEAVFRAHFDETGRCVGTIATIHDVTARKNQELALSRTATTDSLTGLLNRAGFRNRLDHALLSAAPGTLSMAVIDIDRFKLINDNSGHQVGDLVLREIARRIAGEVRAGDAVGRLGGDEFVILLTSPNWEMVQEICNRIVEIVSAEPIMLPSGNALRTAISCGVARYRTGLDADGFIHEADIALYEAKRAGRNRVVAA